MPFKSKSQRRKFYAMARRGEISTKTVAHWERATGRKKLPKYVNRKKGVTNMAKKKRKKASKGGWSAAKLRAYKSAKRELITAFSKKGSKGSVHLSVG